MPLNASIDQLLHTTITTRVVTRVAVAEMPLLGEFGFEPNGPARGEIISPGHRQFGYDIFNNVRTVGKMTAPGTAAATVRANPVGRVELTVPRMHESIPLPAENIHNYRPIGGNAGVFDDAGAQYIVRQQRYMGQRAANWRAALLGGMLQGKAYVHAPPGYDRYVDYTLNSTAIYTLDWKTPAGNLNQLNMLGAGNIIDAPWNDTSADIPRHLELIDVALQQLVGSGLRKIICGAQLWNYITSNDAVQTKAGISGPPWETYTRQAAGDLSRPRNLKTGVIKAAPWLEFVITDAVLFLGPEGQEVATKIIPDGCFWFGPQTPDPAFFQLAQGSEPISEGPAQAPVIKVGMSAWTTWQWNPTATLLFTLDNCIPCAYVPSASGLGTAIF